MIKESCDVAHGNPSRSPAPPPFKVRQYWLLVPTRGCTSSLEAMPCKIAPPRSAEESGEAIFKDRLPAAEDGFVDGEALSLAVLGHVISPRHAKPEVRSPMPTHGAARLHAVEGYPSRLK